MNRVFIFILFFSPPTIDATCRGMTFSQRIFDPLGVHATPSSHRPEVGEKNRRRAIASFRKTRDAVEWQTKWGKSQRLRASPRRGDVVEIKRRQRELFGDGVSFLLADLRFFFMLRHETRRGVDGGRAAQAVLLHHLEVLLARHDVALLETLGGEVLLVRFGGNQERRRGWERDGVGGGGGARGEVCEMRTTKRGKWERKISRRWWRCLRGLELSAGTRDLASRRRVAARDFLLRAVVGSPPCRRAP